MATTTNYSWTTPDDTDLVKDGASAIRSLGSAIDSTVFTNAGNAVQKSTIDAKGDLLVGTADNTITRLAVGTNNYVLTADSAEASGIKWAAAGGGGKVLQVVQDTDTSNFTTTSATFVDTGLSVTITPSSATSKILVMANMPFAWAGMPNGGDYLCYFNLLRGATQICEGGLGNYGILGQSAGSPSAYGAFSMITLDSPATTSATTYKVQAEKGEGTSANYNGSATRINSIIAMEIGA